MLPIYKLVINENDETGVDFVSLVTNPAIERDFQYFNKQVFFNDYPKSASQNAQRGINLNAKLGNDCATLVGKNRARQLVARENLSIETIKRTYSYLSRAKEYYNPSDDKACGTISYLLWGGDEMLNWTERKLEELELSKVKKFAIQDEEKRIISGYAMIADLPIYRYDDVRGEYYVLFDKETIFQIAKKWANGGKYNSVNQHHDKVVDGMTLFESFIIDRKRGINPPSGYGDEVADGSWFLSYFVNNDDAWDKVKSGEFKGFSVEGYFDFEESQEQKIVNALMSALKKWNGKD